MLELKDKMLLTSAKVTLDGKRAVICGAQNAFATIAQLDHPYTRHEWAWETAEKIVREQDGAFKS